MNSHRLQPVIKEKFQMVLAEISQDINIFPADHADFRRNAKIRQCSQTQYLDKELTFQKY